MWWLLLACRPAVEPGEVPLLGLEGEPPANVLILSADTLRRDFVGRYAGTDNTPWMSDFLGSGVVLDDHASCANWTVASFVCLYTGSSALDLGFEPDSGDPDVPDMPADLDSLPEAFQDRGFDTRLVSANPYVHDKPRWPLGKGFDQDWMEANARGELLVDAALDLAPDLRSPWLLQVHFMDTHEPYEAPRSYVEPGPEIDYALADPAEIQRLEGDWATLSADEQADVQAALAAEYLGEVRYLDAQLARLWDGLEGSGALDDTLVLWVSDHGQQHFERSRWSHGKHLHQEETAAVAAFWSQGMTPGVHGGLTVHQDLAATLDTLYGLGLSPLSGVPVGEADPERARFQQYYRSHGGDEEQAVARQSLETETWRLSYAWNGVQRLHHRPSDPLELSDVIEGTDPDQVDALWALLMPQVERIEQALLPHVERVEP